MREKAPASSFWSTKNQSGLARLAGYSKQYISALKTGRQVISPDAARKIGAVTGINPATLYTLSVTKTLTVAKQEHPEVTPSEIMEALGKTMKAVELFDMAGELDRDDPEFKGAMNVLRSMAQKAIEEDEKASEAATKGVTLPPPPHKVERDPFGRSMAVRKNRDTPSRDAHGRALKSSGEKITRDPHGRRIR